MATKTAIEINTHQYAMPGQKHPNHFVYTPKSPHILPTGAFSPFLTKENHIWSLMAMVSPGCAKWGGQSSSECCSETSWGSHNAERCHVGRGAPAEQSPHPKEQHWAGGSHSHGKHRALLFFFGYTRRNHRDINVAASLRALMKINPFNSLQMPFL